MKYGQELLIELEQQLHQIKSRNKERLARVASGDIELGDCFVSKWADTINIELIRTQINILRNGGLADIRTLLNLDGTPADARRVKTKYGVRYVVSRPDGTCEWINPYTSSQTLDKKGYKFDTVRLPAWAKVEGRGYGLAGATQCYITIYPSRLNYWTGEPAGTDREDERNLILVTEGRP